MNIIINENCAVLEFIFCECVSVFEIHVYVLHHLGRYNNCWHCMWWVFLTRNEN